MSPGSMPLSALDEPIVIGNDKIPCVYILFDKYINILALEMASPGNRHCANVSAHFRSLSLAPSLRCLFGSRPSRPTGQRANNKVESLK